MKRARHQTLSQHIFCSYSWLCSAPTGAAHIYSERSKPHVQSLSNPLQAATPCQPLGSNDANTVWKMHIPQDGLRVKSAQALKMDLRSFGKEIP